MDRIVYVINEAPGGADGMASKKDYPGGIRAYELDKERALKRIGKDSRYSLTPIVMDLEAEYDALCGKLSLREWFVLQNYNK